MYCAAVIFGVACCITVSTAFDFEGMTNGAGLQGENLANFLENLEKDLENLPGGNGNYNGNGNVDGNGNNSGNGDEWPYTNGANSTGEANGLNNTGYGNGNNNDGGYNGNNNDGNFNGNNNRGGYNGNNNGGSGNGNGNIGGSNGNGNGLGNITPERTPGKHREMVKEWAADNGFIVDDDELFPSSASTLFLAHLSMLIIAAVLAF